MDPFAQRMFEKAEQRSRALGISNTSKFLPNDEGNNIDAVATSGAGGNYESNVVLYEQAATKQQMQSDKVKNFFSHATTGYSNKLQVVEKSQTSNMACVHSPNKVLRQFSAMDKENMEVGIEINIMADKNLEVQVQVEEQEITDGDDEIANERQNYPEHMINEPLARIRDTSRNRLQRLGALYSNTADLSSPIHRTEGKFHAEPGKDDDTGLDTSPKKINKQRYGKLVTLANSINQWEDDFAHQAHSNGIPPPKPDLPSRHVANKKGPAPPPPGSSTSVNNTNKTPTKEQDKNKEKLLKWDPKVINSLEAQGFQRRESSTVKYAYDYANEKEKSEQAPPQNDEVDESRQTEIELPTKFASGLEKMSKYFGNAKPTDDEKKLDNISCNVKQGLVSGRAAAIEKASQQQQNNQPQKSQKDPTELSLKERRLLFERNKGEALLPKAAFGMAPPINKIRQEVTAALKKDEALRAAASTSSVTAAVKPDSKVREKVAALVANAQNNTEQKIHNDVQKQRREEMEQLSNRFSKQKEMFGSDKSANKIVKAPPPPPPPPAHINVEAIKKRRSPAHSLDATVEEEKKRARKSQTNGNRIYPALSDIEHSDAEKEQFRALVTPSTASAHSTSEEEYERQRLTANQRHICDEEDDDNDSYMDEEEDNLCNVSLGREILQVVEKNDLRQQQQHGEHQQRRHLKEVRYADKNHYYDDVRSRNAGDDSSLNSSEGSAGVDDLMDEALGDGDDDYTQGEEDEDDINASGRSKCTTASKSFSFRKAPGSSYMDCQTIAEEPSEEEYKNAQKTGLLAKPVKSELTINEHQDDNMVTLVHTVSFYRRQQNSSNSTPVRKISREQQILRPNPMNTPEPLHSNLDLQQSTPYTNSHTENESEEDEKLSSEEDNEQLVQTKIKKLLDEVCKQQTIISQTSQALNLCAATVEFSGSTESVEGERHLLVATHRRQACLDEIQRLRVEKSLRSDGVAKEKGCLTVQDITVPLRQDYIRKLAADTISGHHLVCLLKYNEHVLATRSVPTLPGLLAVKFPNVLTLNNVYADFRITLEIYGMTAQREILPHEVKYHINLPKKSGIKTPKKKHQDNRLVMPPVQSPAGPQAVRTPALVQYGFAIFSLREIQRTSWTLTQVREISPLEGAVHMKVNCELSVSVEHKGFLTMFEDISGFGAWHRRWCYLNGAIVSYWKYPDDEKKKAPLGSIDLYTCTSQKINIAPRDICARLNTMLIECQRPAKDTDQESLIIVPNGRTTIVRHLWSADTKEEREVWCAHLNKALTLLRAWGPPQQ